VIPLRVLSLNDLYLCQPNAELGSRQTQRNDVSLGNEWSSVSEMHASAWILLALTTTPALNPTMASRFASSYHHKLVGDRSNGSQGLNCQRMRVNTTFTSAITRYCPCLWTQIKHEPRTIGGTILGGVWSSECGTDAESALIGILFVNSMRTARLLVQITTKSLIRHHKPPAALTR
jgi:hypothetical protein